MDDPAESISKYEKLLQCSGLNEDCLLNILKYLDVCDLLSICDLDTENDKSFTNLINDRVIKTKLFDFGKIQSQRLWSVNKVFENFGKSMKMLKILIIPQAFIHFLRKVIKYCRPNYLSELEIVIYIPDHTSSQLLDDEDELTYTLKTDKNLWAELQPFFRQLQKFTMKSIKRSQKLDPGLFKLIDFPNLKVLTLENVQTEKNWLQLFANQQMCTNITEIRLIDVQLEEDIDIFQMFLHRLTNLEVFIHTHSTLETISVAKKLIQRFPNLRGFGYGDQYGPDPIRSVALDEYLGILRNFPNLTEFHIKTGPCWNFHGILQFWPNIKVLSIWQVGHFQHLPVEARHIFQSIRRIIMERRAHGSVNDRVHLFVAQRQYNEFKAIKDIDKFIRMTIVEK